MGPLTVRALLGYRRSMLRELPQLCREMSDLAEELGRVDLVLALRAVAVDHERLIRQVELTIEAIHRAGAAGHWTPSLGSVAHDLDRLVNRATPAR